MKLVEVIDTCSNIKGICTVSPSKDVCVLACPEKKVGSVRVVHFDKGSKTHLIDAHQAQVAALSLNNEGTILATASDKVGFHFTDLIIRALSSDFSTPRPPPRSRNCEEAVTMPTFIASHLTPCPNS